MMAAVTTESHAVPVRAASAGGAFAGIGAGLRTFVTGAVAVAAALWQMLDLRAELERSAEECAATHPELAARLRAVARSGWME